LTLLSTTLQPQHIVTALLTPCFSERHPESLRRASGEPAVEQQVPRGPSQQPPPGSKGGCLCPGGIWDNQLCLVLIIVIRDNTSQLELYPGLLLRFSHTAGHNVFNYHSIFCVLFISVLFTFFWLIEQQHTCKGVGGRQPYLIQTTAPSKTANMGLKPLPKQSTSLAPALGGREYICLPFF